MQLRVHGQMRGVADAAEGDIGGGEPFRQRCHVDGAEHRLHPCIGVGAALDPLHIGGKGRVGGEHRVAEHVLGEYAPFAIALDRNQNGDAVA